jgi:hypothetical protein
LTIEQSKELVLADLNHPPVREDPYRVYDSDTNARDWGWIFYVERNKDPQSLMAVLVDKVTGALTYSQVGNLAIDFSIERLVRIRRERGII